MRLAEYTDYTLRVLMYCAANRDRLVTIAEIADSYAVSKNHLMKIVNDLARQGVLATTRGRGGGLQLLKSPKDIVIGDVVRASETDFRLVECFDKETNTCSISADCRLRGLLDGALAAYFRQLDSATLADIVRPAPLARARAQPARGRLVPIPVRSRG
ncbi:MAG TPA: Rrf2 family transcriptional regulator [Ramlibacter sp.]|nr:Rrf2 family transcriptional regulator [Ramlibacter sp.]